METYTINVELFDKTKVALADAVAHIRGCGCKCDVLQDLINAKYELLKLRPSASSEGESNG